jgi:cell division protein FtsQ
MPSLSLLTSPRAASEIGPRLRARRPSFLRAFLAEPPRGFGVALTIAFLASTAYYGARLGGQWPVFVAAYGSPGDIVANLAGFRVETVTITGQRALADSQILAASGVTATSSLLFLDAEAARQGLEALPLVKSATVHKLFPDTLAISIEERKPYALWQNDGFVSVVAIDGTPIDTLRDARYSKLPFVVGAGAARRAGEIAELLNKVPQIKGRVRAAVLVAERRWNLNLDNGVVVRLPEEGTGKALAALAELQASDAILDKDILAIDLRLPDRVALRLGADAAAARAEALAKKKKGSQA